MGAAAITLEVLPAGYGDCLLVTCPVGRRAWRMLVDTGPDECYPALRDRLMALPLARDGRRHLDLFVVTHIDHDHIGAAALLLGDEALRLEFDDIWFNAPAALMPRGVEEGQALAELLGSPHRRLPWNRAFGGGLVCTAGPGAYHAIPMGSAGPRLTLLSPTPQRLVRLFRRWDLELARLRDRQSNDRPRRAAARTGGSLDLAELAARTTPSDAALANGSSIAFLLEHQGAGVLLTADAFARVLTPALTILAADRGAARIDVDVLKLSHHGSSGNTDLKLLDAVQARHHVVSTNNAIFDHPDRETLARIICRSPTPVTLWFNYRTDRNLAWDEAGLRQRWRHRCEWPAGPTGGVRIALPGAARAPSGCGSRALQAREQR